MYVYNTKPLTECFIFTATYDWKPHAQSLVKNLRLSKFYRTNTNNLEVKVMWESAPGRFLVKWAPTANCVENKPSYNANTEVTTTALR